MHNRGMDLETRTWLQERIDGRLAAGVAVAWLVAYVIASALEPVTHRPEPWYGVALNLGLLGLVAATVPGLIMERRWAFGVSLLAAVLFTALSVACPVSGHHPFGAWWFGQIACALGMLGFSAFALGRPAVLEREPERVADAALSAGDATSPD